VTVPVLWDTRRDHRQQRVTRNHSDARLGSATWPSGTSTSRPKRSARRSTRSSPISTSRSTTGSTGPDSRPNRALYDEAVDEPFDALDHWDRSSKTNGAGDQLTEADICMPTLIRFDHAHHTHCSQYIHQYQHLTKHPRLAVSAGLSSVVLTVSTRELRTDRRRAVAVGGGQPPTRQRRHHPLACSVGG